MTKHDMGGLASVTVDSHLDDFDTRLANLKAVLPGKVRGLDTPFPAFTLVFAVSDGTTRAVTAQGSGADLDAAWDIATAELKKVMARRKLRGRFLRIDWVEKAETWTWSLLRKRLREVKRNYCRRGIALDPGFERLFLEQELNAQAMLYGGNQVTHCVVNEKNFLLGVQQKYGTGTTVDFRDDGEVHVLETAGLFCGDDGVVRELYGNGRNAGRRRIEPLDSATLLDIIRDSSVFLAHQVGQEGRFVYGYHPCFDRQIPAYNALRHASTIYSMLEAWEKTRQPELLAAIERALEHLSTEFIRTRDDKAFVVDTGNEIKLGANATAILAMSKYTSLLGSDRFAEMMEKLALGILQMQARDGSFTHVLTWPSLEVKEKFRIVYYEGEAAFALMRLYSLTKDERWIGAVERAFGHFIDKDYWKHHDHWLSYCTNELTLYRPELRYFRFGIQNFEGYLDFVLQRITTFPTLLELMMAGRKMLDRLKTMPEAAELLAGLDEAKFDQALHFRAAYLLNGHFWPEYAMFFRNPDRILGSFFIRHHAFRVRIDDVEHYLSGLVAYHGHLSEHESGSASKPQPVDAVKGWNNEHIAAATGGRWERALPNDARVSGVSIHAPSAVPGNILIVRSQPMGVGISSDVAMRVKGAIGIIAADGADVTDIDLPLLRVSDQSSALHDMARYARAHIAGKVIGVTGSSGKTTVTEMIKISLSEIGASAGSRANANLPNGVAWNLASMPWDSDYVVLEMAIGQMYKSAILVQPDVAVFTNVLPAHLGNSSTLEDIALAKSRIFMGMRPGSIAVLNSDMDYIEVVTRAARAAGLRIVSFGQGVDADVRILSYNPHDNLVTLEAFGERLEFRMEAPGLHMAYNSACALAVVAALGGDLHKALPRVEAFRALAGRGEMRAAAFMGKSIAILDDAYNANPGSMRASLERLNYSEGTRRIAVLGQMEDLGEEADRYHDQVLDGISVDKIDKFYFVGHRYGRLWDKLSVECRGGTSESVAEMKALIVRDIRDGDTVLFKGSHSTKMHSLVSWLLAGNAV